MFMRSHGGRIGHNATRDWDDFFQLEQHGAKEAEVEEADDTSDAAEEKEEWEDIKNDLDNIDSKSDEEEEEDDDDNDDDDDDEDRVIADEGEKLGDDVLAEEGYGTL
jgi:hypothetical protein